MYGELLKKLPATFLNEVAVKNFVNHMVVRVNRGKGEYPEEYRFDPIEAAMEECVDIANYAMILYYRLGVLREGLNELGSQESQIQ